METLKLIFLLSILIGSISSFTHSVQTLASITPPKSTEFPTIEFVDTHEAEYDITE